MRSLAHRAVDHCGERPGRGQLPYHRGDGGPPIFDQHPVDAVEGEFQVSGRPRPAVGFEQWEVDNAGTDIVEQVGVRFALGVAPEVDHRPNAERAQVCPPLIIEAVQRISADERIGLGRSTVSRGVATHMSHVPRAGYGDSTLEQVAIARYRRHGHTRRSERTVPEVRGTGKR